MTEKRKEMTAERKEKLEDILKNNRFLVSIETVKIKDFIFSTNKLKLIRGASYLLDYMNQVEVPRILKAHGIKYEAKGLVDSIYGELDDDAFLNKVDEEIDRCIDSRILYIGAGNAKFLVNNESMAEEICMEIKSIYKKMAPSSKVVAEYREIKENEKIWDAIDKLAQITAEKKSEGFPLLNIDLPFVKKCDFSGTEPAVVSWDNVEDDLKNIKIHETGFGADSEEQKENTVNAVKNTIEKNKISEESAVKIKFSNKMIKDDINKIGFYSIIKEALKDRINLNAEIDDYVSKDSFIGFVYSDGDGLGDFLKNTKNIYKTEVEYLNFMRKFSVVLDRNTKYVLKKVILDLHSEDKFKNPQKHHDEKEKLAIGEFLIVGGDDVCAVFPADLALEISSRFQKEFEKKMKVFAEKEGNDENITSSSGVIIAKSKTPMFQLFDQALGRQKSAKAKRYEDNSNKSGKGESRAKTGYIDFQVIGNEGNVDISKYRDKNKRNNVFIRPYLIEEDKELETRSISELIENIKKLKGKKFPNTKIRYIYDLKMDDSKTENEKLMELINIISKMSKDDIETIDTIWKLKENMVLDGDFNKKLFKNIFDILEMYDFVR